MDKVTHLIAESVQINALSAEELCHKFSEGKCQEETGQKSTEQSAVSEEQSIACQVSERSEDTEYDAVTPTENLYNFEKSEGPSLPAQSLHHKHQEIVPYLGNPLNSVHPKHEFISERLIGHQRSSLRPRRIFPCIRLQSITYQDCRDAEDIVPLLGNTVCMSKDESVDDFISQIILSTGFQQIKIIPHSRLQSITDQDSIQNTECETTNRTHLESLHMLSNQQIKKHLMESEGGGTERSTPFGLLDLDEERGQYYGDPSQNIFGKPWEGTILQYWNDDEDEVEALLGAQGFEAEPSTRQGTQNGGKGTAKGKRVSLKEQRRLKSSMKKKHWTGFRQNNGCYDVEGRKESRNPYHPFRGMSLLPYHYSSVSPDVVLSPRPGPPVASWPSITQIFDDVYSRTSQSTKDHRERVIERARKVHHQRCLNRERAYSEGGGKRTCADKMEESRDTVKPEHEADLIKEAKEAQTFKRMKQNKGDKFKVAASELLPSEIAEDKTKINKIKKNGKISKDKRKEKRMANKGESTKLSLEIEAQKETEEVTDDSNISDKSPEENCQSVEVIEQDDLEAQNKRKHCENIKSDDRNYSERKMGNITTKSVIEKNTIGDGHFEEIHSENSQQVEKIRDQLKICENVEEKNVKHQRLNDFPSEAPSVVPKGYDSATESKEHNHTDQGVLEHIICKTSQESYCRETGNSPDTDSVDSVPYATYHSQFRRQNGGTRLPKGRVSAADRRTRSADWENLQQGKQNEANWRWREDSAAAGDWACQNKAELRPTESQRSKRNHSRDQRDSDQNECRPYEGISLFRLHTDRHRGTGDEIVSNGRAKKQRNSQHRKPSRKQRLRGHLPSSSSLSTNWRSKKDELENESINEDSPRQGSWEANNAVCESDRLCDPAVLVSPPKPEPHIRNRRLSPGSGIGGGGGGGCSAGPDKQSRQASPSALEATLNGTGQPFTFAHSRERERRGHTRGRGPRRESLRVGGRPSGDKAQRPGPVQKARWVEDSLSLLKPPPAFPVKDSPAKLQPAVSYASKVKAGGGASGGTEEPPGIGVLLQNQWGLSFISDGPAENSPSMAAPDLAQIPTPQATPETAANHPTPPSHPLTGDMDSEKPALTTPPAPATSSFSMELCNRQDESSGELLLTCRHLVEAMQYHVQEWNTVYNRQKEDPAKVAWYKNSLEQPA
ncbi:uncharacterized protein si:ch211-214j24.10 isoform X2 [Alosa alosa]|uniref:uncharacterized protein si:ch211-214j24.10 isoform X2 n=1 Tax=Alosa alosa TaxID=278164 RepID=UPI0020154503|nr:uncharacterized protein si:ch211-214j24.10 isoform X2 [Alosa alosa]